MQTERQTLRAERAAWLQTRRENHHKALETLARRVGCLTDGLRLWRQLRRIENWTYPQSVKHCNGDGIDGDQWEAIKDEARARLIKVFGRMPEGVYINSDPRGHVIKLDCDKTEIPEGLERDWGGNGILAAEID